MDEGVPVGRPRLDQADGMLAGFSQAARQNAARATRPDDDIIEFFHCPLAKTRVMTGIGTVQPRRLPRLKVVA